MISINREHCSVGLEKTVLVLRKKVLFTWLIMQHPHLPLRAWIGRKTTCKDHVSYQKIMEVVCYLHSTFV